MLAAPLERLLKVAFIWRSDKLRDNDPMNAARLFPVRLTLGVGLAFALLGVVLPSQAKDRDDHDHERAQAAVQAGQVLPLHTLLERVAREHPGQVLEVELERSDGQWVYEIKNLQTDGRLAKLKFDAGTGELINQSERGKRRH